MDRDLRWSFDRAMDRLFPDPEAWELTPGLLIIATVVAVIFVLLAIFA